MNKKLFFEKTRPLVYLITDGESTPANFPEKSRIILSLIQTAVELKVDLIQIREKNLTARLVFELAAEAAAAARDSATGILVNDRADIARAARADGVHLTSASLPAKIIRRSFPPDFMIGVSAHSISEAASAGREGADFVTFSPIYETPSKKKYGAQPQGLEKLKAVCEALEPFPVVALGGIDETNFGEILRAGARGLAAIRFLNDAENLRKLTACLGKG